MIGAVHKREPSFLFSLAVDVDDDVDVVVVGQYHGVSLGYHL